jgi:CRP-like cAMP-binding protein
MPRRKSSAGSTQTFELNAFLLGAGDFLGGGCLAGQPRRMATASALSATTVLAVEKRHRQDTIETRRARARLGPRDG